VLPRRRPRAGDAGNPSGSSRASCPRAAAGGHVRPARAGDRSGMVRSIAGLSDVGLAWPGRPVRLVVPVRHSANALILPGPGGRGHELRHRPVGRVSGRPGLARVGRPDGRASPRGHGRGPALDVRRRRPEPVARHTFAPPRRPARAAPDRGCRHRGRLVATPPAACCLHTTTGRSLRERAELVESVPVVMARRSVGLPDPVRAHEGAPAGREGCARSRPARATPGCRVSLPASRCARPCTCRCAR
jgi:hypothetical protein